ncbi:MAG: hypothetical protein BGO49_25265 [Planctomycetales bacterium 71-10]|nr:MAG: hypothetical protein BGO49_25265 [Planctomycetales bacterium 71-10]
MRRRKSTPRRLLSTPELAEALGYSRRSIQIWRLAGYITPERFEAGRPRWRLAAVREQLVSAARDGRHRFGLTVLGVGGGA